MGTLPTPKTLIFLFVWLQSTLPRECLLSQVEVEGGHDIYVPLPGPTLQRPLTRLRLHRLSALRSPQGPSLGPPGYGGILQSDLAWLSQGWTSPARDLRLSRSSRSSSRRSKIGTTSKMIPGWREGGRRPVQMQVLGYLSREAAVLCQQTVLILEIIASCLLGAGVSLI